MTVIPDKHTFIIWQGASFDETLVIYSDAAGTEIKDLTDYTAEMIIRDKPRGNELISVTYDIDGPNGKINLSLTPEQTAAITWRGAVYDLTITKDDVTDAILYGSVKVQGV